MKKYREKKKSHTLLAYIMRWNKNKACSEASPEQKQTHRRFNLYTHTETRGHKSILMKTFKQKTVDQSRQGDRRVTKIS